LPRAIRGTVLTSVLVLFGLIAAGPLAAQATDNVCDPGESPDIIVAQINGGNYWGTVGGISAYSFATDSCNVGTCQANWYRDTADHPVIGQNLFRLKNGRFQQLGQSWVKHGFAALDSTTCSNDCLVAPDNEHLGVNCSDLYGQTLNGRQTALGRKSEIQADTGIFPFPPADFAATGDAIYKRLQVHDVDINPALNPGASYFVEVQYIARDDSLAGNQDNSVSFRPAGVTVAADGTFRVAVTGATFAEFPALYAWQAAESGVLITPVDLFGRYYVGARVTDLGNGTWHYEYAVQNVTGDGAASFIVPTHAATSVSNLFFSDVAYHSGESYDGTDWLASFDAAHATLTWNTVTVDALANALRWGTLYNFAFDADRPPGLGTVTLGRYVVGSPGGGQKALVETWVPGACDGDGICETAENCDNCPSDCPGIAGNSLCGDGICDPTSGEDCLSCAQDCRGVQTGNQGARFCCGDGAGQNPVDCGDARCNASGFVCASPCCGNGVCDFGEDSCSCGLDCGATSEIACNDGDDDDCDQLVDCADLDCCTNPACDDGIDSDGDSVAHCDCNDANSAVWARPGEVRDVLVGHDAASAVSTISWSPLLEPGGTAPTYRVLRSGDPANFVDATTCLAVANPLLTMATDGVSPAPGAVVHYLVRATNGCPGDEGVGTLGASSSGAEHQGRSCP
jgi:hypothetical protein